ncbi:dienelactone hydrolase-like protein [Aaosphaeria arxii CBS 175.79]|uniref:Dienelactone hydrolase-like protein n=1 Tax=Aaosphaeria arxii CBS 175.79 TaxID=1450172 RepID=A0A6A5XJN7_9PLEO|nr:dienelactone hydrolase-like protein [Aaosphaeria arxii CBS 175.79]KAF2013332.1 dienelactone hydrolase-like protein [Aaosphaeria arxii CBS 175.79]
MAQFYSSNPSTPPIKVSPHLTIQPPLSRRGHGPGLILVADHYASLDESDKHLDPPPLVKWAEEGYAVAQVLIPGKTDEDGSEFPLKRAVEELRKLESCDDGGGFGLISYLTRVPYYVEEATCLSQDIRAIISYGGRKFTSLNTSHTSPLPPQLIHLSGDAKPRRESLSVVPDTSTSTLRAQDSTVKTYRYTDAPKDSAWPLPSSAEYHPSSAKLAHTRSLTFLKPLLNGPHFDLEDIWNEHTRYEFEERDVPKTMATMVSQPYVNHIPTLTGGIGKERLTAFYTHNFIFANPEDTDLKLVSRTIGVDRVVDEFVFRFTHDKVVDWLLPGVPPTGRFLEIPFTSVVNMRGDRLCHEHISWDQATALRQAGLLPEWTDFPYQIDGKEPGAGKKFEVRLPVFGEETSRKLVDEGSVESNTLIEKDGGKGWRETDA